MTKGLNLVLKVVFKVLFKIILDVQVVKVVKVLKDVVQSNKNLKLVRQKK